MKNSLLKFIFLKLFSFIRYFLVIINKYCLPAPPHRNTIIFEMYYQEQIKKCYENFKSHFLTSTLLPYDKYHETLIKSVKSNDVLNKLYYLEFGVNSGYTINFFSNYTHKIYGFDFFKGLSEDWKGFLRMDDMSVFFTKGHFDRAGLPPKVNDNVELVIGKIQDTLLSFLKKNKPLINFIHMDVDTYETTKFILHQTKPYMQKNSIIAFDEIYNFAGWEVGEYKALTQVYNQNEYKFVYFCTNGWQAAIQII